MSPRRCGHCGSTDVRRAMARTDWQRFVRTVTPLRRYSCLSCQRRGWMLGGGGQAGSAGEVGGLPARPLEERDFEEVADARFRRVVTVAIALLLGAALARWLIQP